MAQRRCLAIKTLSGVEEEMSDIPTEVITAYTGLGMIAVIVISVLLAGLYCLVCRKCCDEQK